MPKADAIEIEKRLRMVQEWIIDGWPSIDIETQCVQKWDVSTRQARRYIEQAREKWKGEGDEDTERKRQIKIAELKKLKRSLKEQYKGSPAGIQAIMAVEKELIKLEGLEPAKKLEHSGPNGQPIMTETTHRVVFEDMTQRNAE